MTPPDLRPAGDQLRSAVKNGNLDLPLPAGGATPYRWAALADLGRTDLALARLAEGHTDAVAILAEAGRVPVPDAVYGVWAARPRGIGAELRDGRLAGTVRFCSGAHLVDRALVVAGTPDGLLLVDVAVEPGAAEPDPGSWRTPAMAGADTLDVRFDLPVRDGDVVGGLDWYATRPGFAVGGGGVAAVWWGGAAGVLDRALPHLPDPPDPYQLADLGEIDAALAATDALLARTAAAVDDDPAGDHRIAVARVRSAVERLARDVLERVPRMLGAGPLSGDADLARMLADLGIYVRQHHGDRDHAALGAALLARS
jgi:hypothetical protein